MADITSPQALQPTKPPRTDAAETTFRYAGPDPGTQIAPYPENQAPLSQNLSEAKRFLDALDSSASRFCFQTFDDVKERSDEALARTLHGTLDVCAPKLTRINNRDGGAFVTINAVADGKRRRGENIVRVRSLFADHDRPIGLSELKGVIALAGLPPPSIIVESSLNHWHCYWLTPDCPLSCFTEGQKALAAALGTDPAVCDLPRVMRLPGFIHRKGAPFRTRLVSVL